MSWYVVTHGRCTGVFSGWKKYHDLVNGFKGACYKKYKTKEEAMDAFHCEGEVKEDSNNQNKVQKSSLPYKDIVVVVQFVIILVLVWQLL